MMPDISVVIPCLGGDRQLDQCLQSLARQKDVLFDTYLVLNPPTSTWPPMEADLPRLTRLTSARGANAARNAGLAASRSDLVLFLDSDCWLAEDGLLRAYVEHMANNSQLTGAGGPYGLVGSPGAAARAYHLIHSLWLADGVYSETNLTDHLLGGNMVLRKSKLGSEKFDENLIFGGTEFEFLQRLGRAGHLFQFMPGQLVNHANQLGPKDLNSKARMQGKGFRYMVAKNGEIMMRPQKRLDRPSIPPELAPLLKGYYENFTSAAEHRSRLHEFLWRCRYWFKDLAALNEIIKSS